MQMCQRNFCQLVNVYEKLDRCRYDLHIFEELRQHYVLTSEKSVPAIVNTTDRQPNTNTRKKDLNAIKYKY